MDLTNKARNQFTMSITVEERELLERLKKHRGTSRIKYAIFEVIRNDLGEN